MEDQVENVKSEIQPPLDGPTISRLRFGIVPERERELWTVVINAIYKIRMYALYNVVISDTYFTMGFQFGIVKSLILKVRPRLRSHDPHCAMMII